jgi:hypothetical protein
MKQPKLKNEMAIPFEEDDLNDCVEILRVWITEHDTIAYSANYDHFPENQAAANFGAALAVLASRFALGVEHQFGLDKEVFLTDIANILRDKLYG